MQPYLSSLPGKLFLLAFGLQSAAFGLEGTLDDPGLALRMFVILSSIAICLMIFSTAMGAETHPGATVLVLFIGPIVVWTLYPFIKYLYDETSVISVILCAIGFVSVMAGLTNIPNLLKAETSET